MKNQKQSKVQNKHIPKENLLENRLDEASKKLLQKAMEIAILGKGKAW